MFRSLEIRSIRHAVLLVGVAALLTVTAGGLPRAPSSATIAPGEVRDVLLQVDPIEIPMPTGAPFVG
jgi:hypothetical protein